MFSYEPQFPQEKGERIEDHAAEVKETGISLTEKEWLEKSFNSSSIDAFLTENHMEPRGWYAITVGNEKWVVSVGDATSAEVTIYGENGERHGMVMKKPKFEKKQ